MEDHEIIEYATQAYASSSGDNIVIQEPGPDLGSMEIIDYLDDGTGAWVMAWVYVPIEEETDDDA
jgi:hypothetical protein